MMYQLRPYQKDSVAAVVLHFKKERSPAVIVLPTGAGKSLVIAELARIARGRVLVLAHVKELVEQNHAKYISFGLDAGIFSAGLNRKETTQKVIFGSIQSVINAEKKDQDFFSDFTLVVIDECHRVNMEGETQYFQVIDKLRQSNPEICILGLTATPYRHGFGWIYQIHKTKNDQKTTEERFFKYCLYELPLRYMINHQYLTPPVVIDAPVAAYDFSELKLVNGKYSAEDIENTLKSQERITPSIIKNIVELAKDRKGVMIFTSSVRHAREVLGHLPMGSALVTGETESDERFEIIEAFKAQKIKFLVNVSVLTTGFDAPHVDVIALLRPTESVSLYQQIVGRGLRLYPGKSDCLILDYTGLAHNLFYPEIDDDKPHTNSVIVPVLCPSCGHENQFWGTVENGEVVEHFGRRCTGIFENTESSEWVECGYRFRFKVCGTCGAENDIAARVCRECDVELVDPDKKLKEVMSLKDAHIMKPDSMQLSLRVDKKGERLEVRYYDFDGEHLSEVFYYETFEQKRAFEFNFLRFHKRLPEVSYNFKNIQNIVEHQSVFRLPRFIVARKSGKFWQIREKIF